MLYASSCYAYLGIIGPRAGIDSGAVMPVGISGGNPADDHLGSTFIKDGDVLKSTQSLTSIRGFLHLGWDGISEVEARTHISTVEIWYLKDTNNNGISDEASDTPWVKANLSWNDSIVGANGVANTAPEGSDENWAEIVAGNEDLNGFGNYFILIRVFDSGGTLTNTCPQTSNGTVTGPDEFLTNAANTKGYSTDIRKNGNGSAIDDWEVVYFRINKAPAITPRSSLDLNGVKYACFAGLVILLVGKKHA